MATSRRATRNSRVTLEGRTASSQVFACDDKPAVPQVGQWVPDESTAQTEQLISVLYKRPTETEGESVRP
jgi:hypothetical protein